MQPRAPEAQGGARQCLGVEEGASGIAADERRSARQQVKFGDSRIDVRDSFLLVSAGQRLLDLVVREVLERLFRLRNCPQNIEEIRQRADAVDRRLVLRDRLSEPSSAFVSEITVTV